MSASGEEAAIFKSAAKDTGEALGSAGGKLGGFADTTAGSASPTRCFATSRSCSGVEIFGTSIASGPAAATARSSRHQAVSRPLIRTSTSR